MYDVTWNLSRSQVIGLWQNAVQNALFDLQNSGKQLLLLSGHLIYYGGERQEFYSPVDVNLLRTPDYSPTHLLLLIDDVYDMYARLTARGQIFDPKTRIPGYLGRLKEEERIDVRALPEGELSRLILEWQAGTMVQLLAWRHMEIILAEKLARQLQCPFLVWSVKQLTEAALTWLCKPRPTVVYLSHPISRPRRQHRETHQWPEVVTQFNSLQADLLRHDLVCIMPSGIDEYRLGRVSDGGRRARRLPQLSPRWPLPSQQPGELLYTAPPNADVDHEQIFGAKEWAFNEQVLRTPERVAPNFVENADPVLRSLEQQIECQVSARDHLFVSWAHGLLVFRPLVLDGEWSSGVRAEMAHWDLISRAEPAKRAVIIHFDEDVKQFLSQEDQQASEAIRRDQQIKDEMVTCISKEFGLQERRVERHLEHLERGSEMLDQGPGTPSVEQQIAARLEEFRNKARQTWLVKRLGGHELGPDVTKAISRGQLGVWVVRHHDELRTRYQEIAAFLRDGIPPEPIALDRFWPSSEVAAEA
jgi:hypothetical protein